MIEYQIKTIIYVCLPLRFFSTTTTPLPSAAGSTPTVFLCTKPLKRYEFLDFRLLGSCHITIHYNQTTPPLCWQTDDYTFISLDHSDHLL